MVPTLGLVDLNILDKKVRYVDDVFLRWIMTFCLMHNNLTTQINLQVRAGGQILYIPEKEGIKIFLNGKYISSSYIR